MRTQPMVQTRQPHEPARNETMELRRSKLRFDCENGRCGVLPANAPLANPYVPFQQNNPPTYPAKQGVLRGTLFPGLDLPFHGMINETPLTDSQLHELQTLGFAIVELGEYLDTHEDDQEAFELFRSYVKLYKEGREKYEQMHGPLTQTSAAAAEQYVWLKDPWPWDFGANQKED